MADGSSAVIGFDHNATTPLHPQVREAWRWLLTQEGLGNPSSPHRGGQRARDLVETARRQVAAALGAEPLGVTFTSGGTEADALAIAGTVAARRRAGQPHGVLSSPLEHPAVLGALARLEAQGVPVAWLRPDRQGRLDPAGVAEGLASRPELGLVSLAAANHELGNRYDVPAFVAAARRARPQVTIHVDAVQAFGKIPVDFAAWGVDLLSVSAHKVGGPAGIGALVHGPHAELEPLWRGGSQERGRRPGTESLWLAHAFGVAAEVAVAEQPAAAQGWGRLRPQLVAGVTALGARVHGDPQDHVGNTVNAGFSGCDGQLVVMALDLAGFAVATGAACSAGTAEPSAVLRALGQTADEAREAVRLSMGWTTTAQDVAGLLAALGPAVNRMRAGAAEAKGRVQS
jgi:cysteine desulfurase